MASVNASAVFCELEYSDSDKMNTYDNLMVIVPNRISELIDKGEVVDRYYNPGNLFKHVHIILTNDDAPDPAMMQKMVGDAALYIHNIDPGRKYFHRTLGWQATLVKPLVNKVLTLAQKINPSLIRTYNNFLEGYLAVKIKQKLSIPFVTSLHGVWDKDFTQSNYMKEHIIRMFRRKLEKATLKHADAVIAVYKPIERYARALGAKNVHVIYNAVSEKLLQKKKKSYALSTPPRFITINRQLPEKNPENIIRALRTIDCHYLIVGDGIYHERLKEVARLEGCSKKIEFIKAIPNEQLCKMLPDCDLMLSHCDYWGISKTTIEASLAGIPTILNRHPREPIPDCEGNWLRLCDNTVEGYFEAITELLQDPVKREAQGRQALTHAMDNFSPLAMENKVVALYLALMQKSS